MRSVPILLILAFGPMHVQPDLVSPDYEVLLTYVKDGMEVQRVMADTAGRRFQRDTIFQTSGSIIFASKMALDQENNRNDLHLGTVLTSHSGPILTSLQYHFLPGNELGKLFTETLPIFLTNPPSEQAVAFSFKLCQRNQLREPCFALTTVDGNNDSRMYFGIKAANQWIIRNILLIQNPEKFGTANIDMKLTQTNGVTTFIEVLYVHTDAQGARILNKLDLNIANQNNWSSMVHTDFGKPQNAHVNINIEGNYIAFSSPSVMNSKWGVHTMILINGRWSPAQLFSNPKLHARTHDLAEKSPLGLLLNGVYHGNDQELGLNLLWQHNTVLALKIVDVPAPKILMDAVLPNEITNLSRFPVVELTTSYAGGGMNQFVLSLYPVVNLRNTGPVVIESFISRGSIDQITVESLR